MGTYDVALSESYAAPWKPDFLVYNAYSERETDKEGKEGVAPQLLHRFIASSQHGYRIEDRAHRS